MGRNYTKYTAIEFAADSYFLHWQMAADEESNQFWAVFRKEHPEKENEIQDAMWIVKSIRINDYNFSKEELTAEWIRINHSVKRSFVKRRNRLLSLSAAACFLILVIGYMFVSRSKDHQYLSDVKQLPVIQEKSILLTLSNDSLVAFNQDADITMDLKGNIVVNGVDEKKLFNHESKNDTENNKKQEYNKLFVPWGKRSSLILSDGSKLWINSGTTLEFPSVFAEDRREIKVSGEIYIEVTKNREKPFIVNTASFSVKVLGTKFNVTAYSEDQVKAVVLAEGSVKINTNSGDIMQLKPEERFSMNDSQIKKDHVDVYNFISWKDGIFKFSGESLQNVLTRLSRYYNAPLTCTDDIKNIHLRGKLALLDDLPSVLDNISIILPVKYEIKDDKIVISRNNKK